MPTAGIDRYTGGGNALASAPVALVCSRIFMVLLCTFQYTRSYAEQLCGSAQYPTHMD
jgi:hypothetical protein